MRTIFAMAMALTLPALVGAKPGPTARTPPQQLGRCAFTTVSWVGQRFADNSGRPLVPSPGSAVRLADGVYGVSYDDVAAVQASRVGDPVMTCLARLPRHCPPNDARGKWYVTSNLRTNGAWMLPDAEHQCGGA